MRNLQAYWLAAGSMMFFMSPATAAELIYQPNGVMAPATDGAANVALKGERFQGAIMYRDKVAETELHLEGIDNVVVLDGEATLVTGGDMKESRMISEAEFRGSALTGDTKSIEIHKDDIIQIPAGMPQWIKPHPGGHIRYVVFKVPGRKD
jgi:mannose-6-phosphate isomerase-like protein (cupin superfamily)